MPGLTFFAQYWYPAMYASTAGSFWPPTEAITSVFETRAAATPARQPASCSAKMMPRAFFGAPFSAAAGKSTIANFLSGNRFATAASSVAHQEPDGDHEVVAAWRPSRGSGCSRRRSSR